MANVSDYLKWRGDLSFQQDPFNDVDNLVLAKLSYAGFKDVVPPVGSTSKITLEQAAYKYFEYHDENEFKKSKSFVADVPDFMREMSNCNRYKDIRLSRFIQIIDKKKEEQFEAFTAEIPDGTIYIVFCGTDDNIVGWKEDFNMSFLNPIPSQKEALDYVNGVVGLMSKKVRLGGHSKGGNLAVYAAVNAKNTVKRKIIEVYNNDGPGFDEEMIESEKYQQMLPKIKTIVPEYSIVGMLLEHGGKYKVVKSDADGIMQHDLTSWQVIGNKLENVGQLSSYSSILNSALCNWINGIGKPDRKKFIDTFFSLITASGIEYLSDFSSEILKNAWVAIKTFSAMDSETKTMLRNTLHSLGSECAKVKKNKNVAIDTK